MGCYCIFDSVREVQNWTGSGFILIRYSRQFTQGKMHIRVKLYCYVAKADGQEGGGKTRYMKPVQPHWWI